jgi:HSP20 family protein
MSNITRWEPVREMMSLREAMDHLFDDAFTRPLGFNGGTSLPAIDLYQTEDSVVVRASMPGLKSDDVDITVTGDQITLRGEIKDEHEDKGATYLVREHRFGAFERSLRLPTEVKTDKAKAEFDNGVLTVTLPIAEEVKPKAITIKAK